MSRTTKGKSVRTRLIWKGKKYDRFTYSYKLFRWSR